MRRLKLALFVLTALIGAACDEDASSLLGSRPRKPSVANEPRPTEPGDGALAAGPPMMRDVSNREYLAVVSDLIGERLSPELQKSWTPTTQFSGFDAVP